MERLLCNACSAWLLLIVPIGQATGTPAKAPRGLWLTPRHSVNNQARADVVAHMRQAPREVWRMQTGGSVGYARAVRSGERDTALILVGNALELRHWTGETIWRNARSGISSVLHVANFDARGGDEVCVLTDARTVALLDLDTGRELWKWRSEPSTIISGHKFHATPRGMRFICYPAYSLNGYCFDFAESREQPRLVWQHDYTGKYAAGFGPTIVLKDMDGDDEPDIVLSGKVSHVYQAVVDINTGDIKADTYYEAEPGAPLPMGRPYGLLHAVSLAQGQRPTIALASCQVEEYLGVAHYDGSGKLGRSWGKFIEKDWPEDHLELRPQITSLADLRGTGAIELVIGVWDGIRWSTYVIDPRQGFEARRGTLEGLYYWGCHDFDGDGSEEIVVSREVNRRNSRSTTLEVFSGKTLQPVATMDDAAIVTSADSPLPDDISFNSLRQNPLFLRTTSGERGTLVRRYDGHDELGTFFWTPLDGAGGAARRISDAGVARVDATVDSLLLTDSSGRIQRYAGNLQPIGSKLMTSGRACQPLVWAVGDKVELIVDVAGGALVGGVPDFASDGQLRNRWRVQGTLPAAHIDVHGQSRLVAADLDDVDHPAALIYAGPITAESTPQRVPLEFPPYLGLVPYGDEFSLIVNLQTGVHTMALASYDVAGRLQWQDRTQGAHPRPPAAADLDGDGRCEIVADDHGNLRIYNSDGTVTATDKGWPPAYTIPIVGPFGPLGAMSVVRASGILGLSLIDTSARPVWLSPTAIWRHFNSRAAVANIDGKGTWCAGSLAEDGNFECIDLSTGKIRWSLDLRAAPNATSVVAGDLDASGGDEFLLGLPDGRLVCLIETSGEGSILWQHSFDAAVTNPIIADIDQDGVGEIVVSTLDGYVRILCGTKQTP